MSVALVFESREPVRRRVGFGWFATATAQDCTHGLDAEQVENTSCPWFTARKRRRGTRMTDIREKLGAGTGKFTPLYPELGTDPVSYEDAISPEFFEAEREAIFERSWLYVGRSERI